MLLNYRDFEKPKTWEGRAVTAFIRKNGRVASLFLIPFLLNGWDDLEEASVTRRGSK